MEEFLKSLGLYDLVGYIVPGLIVVWAGLVFCRYHSKRNIEIDTLTVVFAAFIAGHMIQAGASFLDDLLFRGNGRDTVNAVYKSDEDKAFREELLNALHKAFKADMSNRPDELYLCEYYGRIHGRDSYTERFLAYRSLFRGLVIAMTLAMIAPAYVFCRSKKGPVKRTSGWICIVLLCCVGISFGRFLKFDDYWKKSIYWTFYDDYLLPSAKGASESGE
jgi:hypothetical protein